MHATCLGGRRCGLPSTKGGHCFINVAFEGWETDQGAICAGRFGILTRIFLERDANVNIGDNAGVYPFHLVENSTYTDIRRLVPVLMKKVDAVRQGRGF